MFRYVASILLITTLLISAPGASAFQPYAPFQSGDVFPQLSGRTLTNRAIKLPGDTIGKPIVVVFTFSRAAAKDARRWNEQLSRDFANAVPAYAVILLESAPKLFRGMAIAGIRSSMPLSVQDRTIVLYRDESLWKKRLAVSDDSHAYVILLGKNGLIRWRNAAGFGDAGYLALKKELYDLLQPPL